MFIRKKRNETGLFRKNNVRTYLVDGLIAHNSLNFITGPSNIGKTTVIYHFAKCVTDGNDWFGKTIDQGGVMLFDNEMGIYDFDEKMEELGQSNLENFSYIEDQFIDVKNQTEVLGFYSYIQNEVDNHNLKLVIIDSLSACCGNLDENSNTDMRLFMDFADKLSHICTTFVIHHKGKSLENEFRGASIIKDRSDNFFVMDKLGEIKISKNRSGRMRDTKISFDYVRNNSYVSLILDEANSNGFEPKKSLCEIILENLEDGMNQTQLFEKMRSNGVSFIDGDVRKILKSSIRINIERGPNNSSIYKHKR
jgi:archaellum biogenesis ATPase FlaH